MDILLNGIFPEDFIFHRNGQVEIIDMEQCQHITGKLSSITIVRECIIVNISSPCRSIGKLSEELGPNLKKFVPKGDVTTIIKRNSGDIVLRTSFCVIIFRSIATSSASSDELEGDRESEEAQPLN